MKKIIKVGVTGKGIAQGVCCTCGCEFTFEKDDVEIRGYTGRRLVEVTTAYPQCGHSVSTRQLDFTQSSGYAV